MPRFITSTRYDNGTEIRNATMEHVADEPASPTTGQIWYDTIDGILRYQAASEIVDITTGGVVPEMYPANSILKADTAGTPIALTVAPSTFVGRSSVGGISALTPAMAKTELAITPVDVTGFTTAVQSTRLDQFAAPTSSVSLNGQKLLNVAAPTTDSDGVNKAYADTHGGVSPDTWDANTIVKADADNTPVALAVNPSTIVGRAASGSIAALTAAQAKAVLSITASDITGLGPLASVSSVTTTEIADNTITNTDISPTAAIALSKLATDPLNRTNHTGTQIASTISDFTTAVRANRLDQMATPAANVAWGSVGLTNAGFLSLGTTPAASGHVRLTNTNSITARNSGNTGDVTLVSSSGNGVMIGASGIPIGFFGVGPAARSTGWSPSGYSNTTAVAANNTTLSAVANCLCTLIATLQSYGLLG
jgi:hypothetical protein